MRGALKLFGLIIVVLVLAWVGLWWSVENRMQAGVLGWVKQEQASGALQVDYDQIVRGYSPLAATITLINPRLTASATGEAVRAPSLGLRISAFSPFVQQIDWPAQMTITAPRGNIGVTFGHTEIAYTLDPRALFSPGIYPFTGEHFDLQNTTILAGGGLPVLQIDDISGHGTMNANAGANQNMLSTTEDINGIAISPALTSFLRIPFGGKITHLGGSLTLSGPLDWQTFQQQLSILPPGAARRQFLVQTLHGWAAKGGNGSSSFTLTLGPSTLNANGTVAFDVKTQPMGTGTLTADHLDALTAALETAYPFTQGDINNIEAKLSPYLSTSATNGQALNIQAAYGNGAVMVNGAKATDLPPLDWAALQNPPAPPPQAPGDGSGAATAN